MPDDPIRAWWLRVRAKTRRVFSFAMLSASEGVGGWKPVWVVVACITGWSIIAVIGAALKADILVILVAIGLATAMTLATGAFRAWDKSDTEVSSLRAAESTLFDEYAEFLAWAYSREPKDRPPTIIFTEVGSQAYLANQQVIQDDRKEKDQWRREILGRYHDKFRTRILAVLHRADEQTQAEWKKVNVSEPSSLDDLQMIADVLPTLQPTTPVPYSAQPSTEKES